jgi:ubiquinone/menaquinone biosynthesis C-methylase UbiE
VDHADAVDDSAVRAFYRVQARVYDCTRWLFLFDRAWAVRKLRIMPGQTVMEIGCGTGLNLPLLRNAVGPSGSVVGVDFSGDMLARAERKVERGGWRNVRLVQADATHLQLNAQCDVAFFAYSLTMIPDWRAALSRVLGHVRPGGRLGVLDFGDFAGWGRLARGVAAWWLRQSHVETQRSYIEALANCLADLEYYPRRGGYNFLAVGRRME